MLKDHCLSLLSLVKNGELQGDGNATAILAEFYIHGVGVPEDVETGIELLEKAIDIIKKACE